MSDPVILVGIVTRNRADILPQAITSALAQRGCPLQVAVVDDGSTDDTADVAKQFPMVAWTRWEVNKGLMPARNHLMNSNHVDYFVSLDDDAWFLRGDEIALAVEYLERNSCVAAIAFDILSPDRPKPKPCGTPHPTATFIGCGHVLRLAAIRKVGAYESTPGSYGGEEKDLCLRLLDAGFQTVLLPGVHVWHDKTPVARVFPDQFCSCVCNDLAFTLRRTPALLLPVAFLVKFFQHGLFSWRRGMMRPCFEGGALFLRSFGDLWHSRCPVKLATLRSFMRLARS